MGLLTVTQLERQIYGAVDLLRGQMDVSQYRDVIAGLLLLKRASDQPGTLQVLDRARWSSVITGADRDIGDALNKALSQLEWSNHEALKGAFDALDFNDQKFLGPHLLRALVHHFSAIHLQDSDLEFPDVVGRAYSRLLARSAQSAGRTGGVSHTPESVVDMMVRLVRPEPEQSVYDPFVGTGGMLIQAQQYVDEKHGDGARLALSGQEKNANTWATARLNLLLHGITDSSVHRGDTLQDPLHTLPNGQLRRFDRVLTNPPFSMNYDKEAMRHPERMRYGWAPTGGGKADLMNVQHVLAVLEPEGKGAVVAPQGVLFRGGAEAEIRRAIIEEGRLEAVIGIGANVFYGTGIPACVLVLRGVDGLPPEQRGTVLFINAEHEVASGRAQNRIEPQHVEKILGAYRSRLEIDNFARVVSLEEIRAKGYNLNIRHYVDATPASEPLLDVSAALFGGVPRGEVEAEEELFEVFGIKPYTLFRRRGNEYFDFLDEGFEATAARIPELAEVYERAFIDLFSRWWEETADRVHFDGSVCLLSRRDELMSSFREELLHHGLLDEYQLNGLFAAWWSCHKEDLRSLDRRGFAAVLERRAETCSDRSLQVPEELARERVLKDLGDDLRSRLRSLVRVKRQELVDMFLSWGDRYAVSFTDLEHRRRAAAARFEVTLRGLGYR
ncbi:N-6 DNA methylase [Streptomyces atratus]